VLARLPEVLPAFEILPNPPTEDVVIWLEAGFGTDAMIAAGAVVADVQYLCTGDAGLLGRLALHQDLPTGIRPAELLRVLQTDS
jgi:hypothetical protein